jgi:hypothetical protein
MGINTNRDTVELVEPMLDRVAYVWGIDREDESSYDSGEFPKVVFRDMTDDDTCGSRGRTLGA